MYCRVTDLRYKDVVNIHDGTRIGYVCDVEVDTATARVISIIIYGRYRWFGLLGREDDIIIQWCDINLIGEDTILVNFDCCGRPRRGYFGRFGNNNCNNNCKL